MTRRLPLGATALALALALPLVAAGNGRKVPITTKSEDARALYLKGREAAENLRAEDARRLHAQAVEKDPGFALGHLAVAQNAQTAQGFFDALRRAVELAPSASEGERWLILSADAGARGDPKAQLALLGKLAAAYPEDERVHNQLGNVHFGRQEYPEAIARYERAIALNPGFPQPYNQLGYAHRFTGQLEQAEKVFRKYVEILPNEPNPHDSYAELLMKMGRFQDSIAAYEKALAVDPQFVPSYVGIANDQVFLGKGDEARRTLAKLRDRVARNDGEKRQALFWTAASWVHEGNTAKALEACREMSRIAERGGDVPNLPGDHVLMGQILLHAKKLDAAKAEFAKAVKAMEGAKVPPETKEAVRRNDLYFQALVALDAGDLAAAARGTDAYRAEVDRRRIPLEVRRVHELTGRLALAKRAYAEAVQELSLANQQDPVVLAHLAEAHRGAGELEKARAVTKQVAELNELNFNLAFVRAKARQALANAAPAGG
jgi:tetratricopeptide (TPR) repeat protein